MMFFLMLLEAWRNTDFLCVVDVRGYSKIMKKITKKGEAYDHPNEGSLAKVIFVGKLEDGTTIERQGSSEEPFEYVCGEGQVHEGLDRAVMRMRKGEEAVVKISSVGAMLIALYKGHVISMISSTTHQDWVKGSVLLIIATFSWASFFILQALTMRKYTAQLSLIAIVCFLGTLQSTALSFVMEQTASAWSIGWDMNLFAAAYAGIVSSGIAYYVQGIVMEKRGPFLLQHLVH